MEGRKRWEGEKRMEGRKGGKRGRKKEEVGRGVRKEKRKKEEEQEEEGGKRKGVKQTWQPPQPCRVPV